MAKLLIICGVSLGLFYASPGAFGLPAQVTIIRHGEKPDVGKDLSDVGYARANALPAFFAHDPLINSVGPVDKLYAMSPKSDKGSERAIETLTPTAEALKLNLDEDYLRDDVKGLTHEILTNPELNGKNVVICWEHSVIPLIAYSLGADAPSKWKKPVFDRAWVLKFNADKSVSFQNIGEQVLPGDSPREKNY